VASRCRERSHRAGVLAASSTSARPSQAVPTISQRGSSKRRKASKSIVWSSARKTRGRCFIGTWVVFGICLQEKNGVGDGHEHLHLGAATSLAKQSVPSKLRQRQPGGDHGVGCRTRAEGQVRSRVRLCSWPARSMNNSPGLPKAFFVAVLLCFISAFALNRHTSLLCFDVLSANR
jgi:hypothetical protein